ncbi:MAG: Ig-like domain-containing protein [bacterium]|nr:Ig-like domain-containing protein [bacterium]
MQHPPHRSWRPLILGLGSFILIVLGFLAVGHYAQAITIENVGGSLGLGNADLKQTIINILKWALGLLGLVAVMVMLYGGFLWLTSGGDEKKIEKAKRTLINGVIGLVIILVSWAIVLFIQRFITNATTSGAVAAECTLGAPTPICTLCIDDGDGDTFGILAPDPLCISPDLRDYYATWEDPNDQAVNVKLCQAVSAGFGGLIPTAPNPPYENDIGSGALALEDCPGGVCASGTSVSGTAINVNNVATFVPSADYVPNTKYTVNTTSITSIAPGSVPASRPIPPDGWTFTTGTEDDEDPPTVLATAPTHNEIIQCLSPIIEVQFNEGMFPPSAMNPANFTLMPAHATVTRVDMPTPDIIQITLSQPLQKNQTYTVTLSANNGAVTTLGYRDTCANALDCGDGLGTCTDNGTADGAPTDNYRFDFTTADTDTIDCTPIITGVTNPAYHGNQADPYPVTITGSNFGLGAVNVRFSGNVLATPNGGTVSQCFANNNFANQTASPACLVSADNTTIQTIVPTGPLRDGPITASSYDPTGAIYGPLVVEKATQISPPSSTDADIQSPHIDWVSPHEGKAGRFVTISGSSFGTSGTVAFRRNDGTPTPASTPSCVTNGWTDTEIVVQVPEGFAFDDVTHIQVNSDTFNDVRGISNTARFDIKNVDGPNLCSITPNESNDPMREVNALGEGFSAGPITIGYSYLAGTLNSLIDDKNLTAQPSGALPASTYNFYVTVNGRASNPRSFKYPADDIPQVVQNAACNPGAGVLPSTNPYPGSTNICRNISLQARFTEVMDATTLTTGNITMRRCGAGTEDTFTTCTAPQAVTIGAPVVTTTTLADDTVTLTPAAVLEGNFWYEVTLGTGIQSAAGVAMSAPFSWHFRVRSGVINCDADSVVVSPVSIGPLYTAQLGTFDASAVGAQCALLTGLPGSFSWVSSDATLASVVSSNNPAIPPLPSPDNNRGTATVVGGTNNGTAQIRATYSGKTGSGNLIVQRNYCDTDADCTGRQNDGGSYFCTGSSCNVPTHQCRPWIRDIEFPTGPAGNMLNVNGCFFGNAKGSGEVTFSNPGPPPTVENGSFAICGPTGWNNDFIKVQAMPESAAVGSAWDVQVRTDTSYGGFTSNPSTYTITNVCRSQIGTNVSVPSTGVPILCNITPPARREGESVTYNGSRFIPTNTPPSSQAFFTEANGPLNQLPLPGDSTTVSSVTIAASNVPTTAGIPSGGTTAKTTIGTPSGGQFCIATPVDFAVSCNQNSECSTGCCQTNICRPTLNCTNGLVTRVDNPTGTCRNTQFSIIIAAGKTVIPSTVNAGTIKLLKGITEIPTTLQIAGQIITVRPTAPLGDGIYTVVLPGGVTGIQAMDGANIVYLPAAGFISAAYTVDASFRICIIASVSINSAITGLPISDDLFTCSGDSCTDDAFGAAGNQHAYLVRAYDANGDGPLTLSTAGWTQADTSPTFGPSNTFAPATSPPPAPCPENETSENYCATGQNVANGSEQLTVAVVGPVFNGVPSGSGTAAIPIRTFLCAKPWPTPPAVFPFRDPATATIPSHDFTFGFCRDDVNSASLDAPVFGPPAGEVRKEYFMFVNDKDGNRTGDSIGVRVIGSATEPLGVYRIDLSPKRWYERTFGKASTGTTFEVDGYPALREGRTVYVVADYYDADTNWSHPAVYVFSHTDNARSETVQIFEQILKNLRFNASAGSDLKTDLRNDLKRFHALNEVVYGIAAYHRANGKNPSLDTGTYIKHMTLTAWPSWQQEFGRVLGVTLPQDPQGLWDPTATPRLLPALCSKEATLTTAAFNQTTCWNEVDKIFEFPSDNTNPLESTGIAYVYNADGSATIYSTGSERVGAHITDYHTPYGSPIADFCPGQSSCQGFNIVIGSTTNFGNIDLLRQKPPADVTDPNNPTIDAPAAGNIAGIVTFVVTATDNPGGSGIGSVAFNIKRAGIEIATSTVVTPSDDGKYRWIWNSRSVVNGAYTLSVTATDRAGNAPPLPVTLNYTVANPPGDNEPPVITIAPPPISPWTGTDVTLTAIATDLHPIITTNNTGVTKIEFYLGSSKLGQAPDPTCTAGCPDSYTANVTVPAATIAGFPDGSYTYTVVAYDGYGNTSVKTYPIVINKGGSEIVPPVVSIILPTDPVSGANTEVVATASDASGIDRVEFFVDGTFRVADFSGPYGFSWLLTGYAENSPHTVSAVAYDRNGNQTTAMQSVTYVTAAPPDTLRPVISDVTVTLATNETVDMEGAQLQHTVTLNAILTDNVAMLKAELRIDGVKVPGIVCAPSPQTCTITYLWDTLPEVVGSHTVTITAYDTSYYATTVSRTVNVVNQVIMSLSSPLSGTTVKDAPTGFCAITTSQICTTSNDCPITGLGTCEISGEKCLGDAACPAPGDFCDGPRQACNIAPAGVPVIIDVTRTCRTDQLLSSVQFFIDSSTTPLPGAATCTNGKCTYTWNTKTTTSNGSHTLTAIGTDSLLCKGGAKSTVVVNNDVNDTVPPTITSLNYLGVNWSGGPAVYINVVNGDITLAAQDNIGGSGLAQLLITVKNSAGTTIQTQDCGVVTPCELLTWNPPDGGNYTVTAHVEDVAGNVVDLIQVVNVDRTLPQITWTSPVNGSTVNSPPDVTLTADATDPQSNGYASGILSVVFSQNGAAFFPLATGSGSTYSGTYPLAFGSNQLFTAVVTDRAGNTFTTPNVSLTVVGLDTTPPTSVSITTPSADNWWFNGTTTIVASAQDNVGGSGIGSVQFYLDGASLGVADTIAPYSTAWNTTTATNGQTYSITARACDRAPTPNCLTSAPRLMRVWNEVGYNPCQINLCSGATSYCCNGVTCQNPLTVCGGGAT